MKMVWGGGVVLLAVAVLSEYFSEVGYVQKQRKPI